MSDAPPDVKTEIQLRALERHGPPRPDMKNAIAMTLSALIAICAPAFAASGQSTLQPSGTAASLNHHDAAKQLQTTTGRIIGMDGKSGLISVRASDSGKAIDLKVGQDLIARLRTGERVVVSYSGKTAIRIIATRSGHEV